MLKTVRAWLDRSLSLKAIIITLAVLGCFAAVIVSVGFVDISADRPDGWLAEHFLHFVFKRSEALHSHDVTPPDDLRAPSRVRLAAQQFDMECANCHGRPGFGQSVIALSMSPRPQYLPKVLGQFTDPELYMIVKHGVKYSAMPSWPTEARVDEVWSMVAFLRQLPKLNAQSYRQMTALPTGGDAGPSGTVGDTILRPANAQRNAPPTNEFLYAAPSTGFADQTVHESPVPTCARCHGADGSGGVTGGEAPNLTIQSADYLRSALQSYTSGARQSGFMQTIAAELSGAQIASLSDYYAGLPVKTVSAPAADPALVKRGEAIATGGVPELAVPACANCHEGPGSQIVGAPHIAGQSATYLSRQLHAMSRGGRGSSVRWNPMFAVAHDLSDNDLAALAAYYSGLKPAKGAGTGQAASPTPAPLTANGAKVDMHAAKAIFASVCANCHVNGARGDVEGNYPNLTLQTTPYVAQSLYSFRTHARGGGKMQEVTSTLNFDQMASLAAYVNSLSPQPALGKIDAAAAARGAGIAANGVPARGVPACLSCHGKKGVEALPLIPRLQGQNTAYLSRKLRNFARAYSSPPNALNPMPAIATLLTAHDIADLAAYFAAAPPLKKTAEP